MKKSFIFKILLIFIVLVWSGVTFVFGFYQGYKQIPGPPNELVTEADVSLLWDVWNKLENKYIGQLDHQQMIYGAAKGLAESLGDPYTVFFKPADTKTFKDDISGSFEGVGMEITVKDGSLIVVAPLEGTPAKAAGILPGDEIVMIEDVFAKDISVDQAVKMIRGEGGTQVNLSILRKGWDEAKIFSIIRAEIVIPSMEVEFLENDIAVIKIYQFSSVLTNEFQKKVGVLIHSNTKKIILDLRNNPGGLLNQAQNIAGWFIEKGKIVTTEDKGEGEEKEEYLAVGNEAFINYPIVILMNGGTASGAEILAAALRENRDDVKLIGEKSFGKGSVQEPVDLRGGSLLKITIAHWLTPDGNLIDNKGLIPDIDVELTEDDYLNEKDPQMERAIEELKNM
ncbi:S41 family peptidase [Patescibacteria group bacterium]|nr:S41 family peptidase [Patescibacteria group bacterium]MBU4022964.1 S41 family peptidase [Patescibacteria group bacterium]MBU4078091.1 S41 family peptidase [Patescibacteria group bacterium]